MLLLITVMCVIAEKKQKKLQLNSASLYVVVIFIIGGILIGGRGAGPSGPPWQRLCWRAKHIYKYRVKIVQ